MSEDQAAAKAKADQAYRVARALHLLTKEAPDFAAELTRQAQQWQALGTPFWMQAHGRRVRA